MLQHLGSGVTRDNTASDAAGTYEGVSLLTNTADTSDFCPLKAASTPTVTCLTTSSSPWPFFPSGFAMNWMMDLLRYNNAPTTKGELFARLDAEVATLGDGPTGVFVLPHFVGSCSPSL